MPFEGGVSTIWLYSMRDLLLDAVVSTANWVSDIAKFAAHVQETKRMNQKYDLIQREYIALFSGNLQKNPVPDSLQRALAKLLMVFKRLFNTLE